MSGNGNGRLDGGGGPGSDRPTQADRTITKRAVVAVYQHFAPIYDATFGRPFAAWYHHHLVDVVRESGAQRILEIGVGTGLSLRHYPPEVLVVGADLCSNMLGKARRRVDRGVGAQVRLLLADGESLPFRDASYDLVVLFFVMPVTPNPATMLGEVARVLKPDGKVLMVNHFGGVKGMGLVERWLEPVANRLGFRSRFALDEVRGHPQLREEGLRRLWPAGFFQLVRLRRTHPQ
jgi:phosphatidylethanolamine/phosphatidyl-N-methylethanolamine N-methyltransferase